MTGVATARHPLARLRDDGRVALARAIRDEGLLPFFRCAESTVAPEVVVEGRPRIMLGSANYLGLADHPAVMRAARDAVDSYGSTITGSRLLNGTTRLHTELEEELADWHGTEASLVFTTGYQANLGAISALVGRGDTVVVDSACHASLLDGCALSGAKTRAFEHNRVDLLEEALEKATTKDGGGILVVVDGLYSMEGDLAPLDRIAAAAGAAGAGLMVDEAHSVGVLGARGTGAAELFSVERGVAVRMGALSKALGSVGGFVAGSEDLVDLLRFRARPLLFTTASIPAALGAALAGIRVRRSAEGEERAAAVLDAAAYLSEGLAALGLTVTTGSELPDGRHQVTPIVSVVIGDDLEAASWWRALYERGVFASVAMHPAVRPRRALLRLSTMATHTRAHLDRVLEAFGATAAERGPRP